MPFTQEQSVVDEVGQAYGTYVSTFVSSTGQATAHLFEVEGELVAHVSFARGLGIGTATDRYLADLREFARDNGYGGKVKLVFAEQSQWT